MNPAGVKVHNPKDKGGSGLGLLKTPIKSLERYSADSAGLFTPHNWRL